MKKIVIILLLITCWLTSNSQTKILSLDSVLAGIEKNSPSLNMYNAKINALNEYAQGAKSWDAPTVGAGLWMTPYKDPYMGMAMISIEQMIPNPSKLNAKKDYMSSMNLEQVENKNNAKNQLFALAKKNYHRMVILKRKQIVFKDAESIIEMMIKSAELSYSNADTKLNTIYKIKARLAGVKGSCIALENEIRQKQMLINTLMNRDVNLVFEVDTAYQVKSYEITIPDSSLFSANRSDLKAIDRSADVLKFRQKLESTKGKPSYGVRYNNMTPFNQSRPSMYNIMGMLTIPIAPWSSKEYKSNIKAIDFEIEELKWKKKSLLNDAMGKTSVLLSAIQNSKQQMDIYQKSILPALQNNFNASQLAYSQNKESLFVVLDAWEALNNGKMEYLNKVEELLYLQIDYEKEIEQK